MRISIYKNVKIQSFVFLFSIILISLFNIFLFGNASNILSSLSSDNLVSGTWSFEENLFSNLYPYNFHAGGYTASFLVRIFEQGISSFFGVHILDFIGYPLGIIKGIIFSCLLLSLTRACLFFEKSKFLFVSTYLYLSISSFVLFIFTTNSEGLMLTGNNTFFFRFIIPMIFYFLFLKSIYRMLIAPIKASKNIILSYLCTFIFCLFICTNYELLIVQIFLTYFLILLFDFIAKHNLKEKKFFNFPNLFWFSSFCCIIISFLYITSPSMKELLNVRIDNLQNIDIFSVLHSFLPEFIKNCFTNFWIYHLAFITLSITAFSIKQNKKETKKIFFPIVIYLSIIFSLCSLAFVSKEGINYIIDYRILYMYYLIIIYSIFLLISYILKHIKRKKLYTTILSIFLLLSSCILSIKIPSNFYNNVVLLNPYNKERKVNYIQEKIYRFYNLKNQVPYLDKLNIESSEEQCRLWIPSPNKSEINDSCYLLCPTDYVYFLYLNNYKIEPSQDICFSNNAIDLFYKNGGEFNAEELQEPKFDRLRDKKYVLNTGHPKKVSPEELKIFLSTIVQ